MDVRKKLVELLQEFVEVDTWDNGEFIEKDIDFDKIAENLIANSVTVQEHGWIKIYAGSMYPYSCSKCGNCHARIVNFCESCGTKLDLPQSQKGDKN